MKLKGSLIKAADMEDQKTDAAHEVTEITRKTRLGQKQHVITSQLMINPGSPA